MFHKCSYIRLIAILEEHLQSYILHGNVIISRGPLHWSTFFDGAGFFQISICSQPSFFTNEQVQPHTLSGLLTGIHFDKATVVICSSKCYVWSNYFTQTAALLEDLLSEYMLFPITSLALISFRAAMTFLQPLRGTTLGINIS